MSSQVTWLPGANIAQSFYSLFSVPTHQGFVTRAWAPRWYLELGYFLDPKSRSPVPLQPYRHSSNSVHVISPSGTYHKHGSTAAWPSAWFPTWVSTIAAAPEPAPYQVPHLKTSKSAVDSSGLAISGTSKSKLISYPGADAGLKGLLASIWDACRL